MITRVGVAVLSALLFVVPVFVQVKHTSKEPVSTAQKKLNQHVNDAVAELYIQDATGNMRTTCTATAFEKTPTGYLFVSAAHCVQGEKDADQKLLKFYVTSDKTNEKNFIAAKLIEAGDKSVGDDFSLFEVITNEQYDVVPLGDENLLNTGDEVVDVADPMGLGKQFFVGYVSEIKLDRPPVDAGKVKWKNAMMIYIGGGPGSSGSAIVSTDQKAIVAFLVAVESADIGKICVPVSQFKVFVKAVQAGTYKKTPPDLSKIVDAQ